MNLATRRLSVIAVASLVLVTASCGNDKGDGAASTSAQPTTTLASTTVSSAPDASAATPDTAASSDSTTASDATTSTAKADCSKAASPIKVGVVLASVGNGGALNEALGLPSVDEQRGHFKAVFDDINESGGPGCHQLEPVFQAFNYIDPASTQSSCLEFVQAEVEAMLGGYQATSTNACPLENKIAVFDNGGALMPSEIKDNYPYYFGSNINVTYRNFAHAAADEGYFSTKLGDGKIGLVYRDCVPERLELIRAALTEVKVDLDQVSSFSLGCPQGPASPASLQQAVLQFKKDKVTVMVSIADSDTPPLSTTAQQQDFHPLWAMPDNSLIATTTAATATKPDPTNFDGAFVVIGSRYGEDPTKATDAPTARCDAIMAKAGLKSIADSPAHYAGAACVYVWVLAAAIEHATDASAKGLADGLRAAKSVALPFPAGPNNFDHEQSTYGNGPWRVVRYNGSCGCWDVPDPAFNPAAP